MMKRRKIIGQKVSIVLRCQTLKKFSAGTKKILFSSEFYHQFMNRTCPSEYLTPEYWIYLNTGQYGCTVFKWSSHVTWRTIQILDILDQKQAFFSPVFRPPFEYRTQIFHFNTRLVQYSDGYCIWTVPVGRMIQLLSYGLETGLNIFFMFILITWRVQTNLTQNGQVFKTLLENWAKNAQTFANRG